MKLSPVNRTFLLLALVFLVNAGVQARAQTQQDNRPRTASIAGRVTIGGKPASNAKVAVEEAREPRLGENTSVYEHFAQLAKRVSQDALTDGDGRYRAGDLPEGNFEVRVMLSAYVAEADDGRNGLTRTVAVEEGESLASVDFSLVRGGVITGRVTDDRGRPLIGHSVQLRRLNERGEAQPYIEGMLRPRREQAIYHPSSPRSGATEIAVRAGEEVTGIDIRHRVLRGHSIGGTLSGEVEAEGFFNNVVVMLTGALSQQPAGMAMSLGDRKFLLGGVEDGEYDLTAMRAGGTMEFALSAPRRVRVSGADLSGIDLKLLNLGAISGRVTIESAPANRCKSADEASIEEVLLDAVRDEKTPGLFQSLDPFGENMLGAFGAVPDKGGAFTAKNVEPGRVRLVADLPGENWHVRAITQGASPKLIDVGRNGIVVKSGEKLSGVEVRIAGGAASLGGKLVPANDAVKLSKRMQVHLIPTAADAASDVLRYAETMVGGDDAFAFKHLAPGKYWLLARPAAEIADRPLAWDAAERAKLRREAEAAKNEVDLKPCDRVTGYEIRLGR